jgi:pyruvate carboxylase
MAGKLGQPYGGFPKRLQQAILKGRPAISDRGGDHIPPHDFDAASTRLSEKLGRAPTESELLSDALYSEVFDDFLSHEETFGDVSILPTPAFLYGLRVGEEVSVDIEVGKTIIVKLVAIGGVTPEGQRTVFFEMNGQPREVAVRDHAAAAGVEQRVMADPNDPLDVGASMPGKVLSIVHQVGDTVEAGEAVLVLEAMKMETAITASIAGVIEKITVSVGDDAKAGELLIRLRAAE